MARFLRLLLALAAPAAARAEAAGVGRISGQVLDHATHRPVAAATVVLQSAAGVPVRKVASDAAGEFSFPAVPFGEYKIIYSRAGAPPQASAALQVDGAHPDRQAGALEIGSDAVQLERMEVTTTREAYSNSIDRKTYAVGRDLKSVSGSAADLLQNIPSVQVDVDGNVSLRGDSSVLILIDGRPSTLLSATNRPDVLAQMAADGIERIEVITNPSAKYKPDGTAGIINLVLQKQQRAGLSGSVRASVGTDSRANAALTLGYNPGRYTISGSASFRQDDRNRVNSEHRSHVADPGNAVVTTDQATTEHMRPLTRLTQLGLDYRPNATDKFSVAASYNLRTFFRTSVVTNVTRDASGLATSDYDRHRADDEWQKTVEVKAGYGHKFAAEGGELTVDAKRDRHQELEDNHYLNSYRLPAAPDSRDVTRTNPTETGTELTAEYTRPLAGDTEFEAGYAGEQNQHDMDFRGAFFDPASQQWSNDATRTNRFIYRDSIQALYFTYGRPLGRWGLLAGLRLEDTVVHTDQATIARVDRTEYWRVHPSLHLGYSVGEHGQLQLNYSHRVRRPESDDLNPFPEYQDPFNLRAGNPHLRPEETHSLESGYQFKHDDTTWLAALFFRDTNHAFTTVTRYLDPVTLLTTQENLAHNRSGGLELAATAELWSGLTVNFSSNAFRSEVDAANLGIDGKRSALAWDAKLNLAWRVTKSDSLQWDANYAARRLTAQGYRRPNAFANAGWRHDFKNRHYAFTLTISDVFDSLKERTVIDTATLHDEITRRRSSRIIYAGFSYNFGQSPKKGKKDDLQFDTAL